MVAVEAAHPPLLLALLEGVPQARRHLLQVLQSLVEQPHPPTAQPVKPPFVQACAWRAGMGGEVRRRRRHSHLLLLLLLLAVQRVQPLPRALLKL